jgi:hypothetical protein
MFAAGLDNRRVDLNFWLSIERNRKKRKRSGNDTRNILKQPLRKSEKCSGELLWHVIKLAMSFFLIWFVSCFAYFAYLYYL